MDLQPANSLRGPSMARGSGLGRLFTRRRLWLWPIVAAGALAVGGYFLRSLVERSFAKQLETQLEAVLRTDVEALRIWLAQQKRFAEAAAKDRHVRSAIAQLRQIADASPAPKAELLAADALQQLRTRLEPWVADAEMDGFVVFGPDGRVLAARRDEPVGEIGLVPEDDPLDAVFEGKTVVTTPRRSPYRVPDAAGNLVQEANLILAAAPIATEEGEVLAGLALACFAEGEFSRILQTARIGETGETCAFDAQGKLLSASLFVEQHKALGLLPDRPEVGSILNTELRDPGADLTRGAPPAARRSELPFVKPVRLAPTAGEGVDVVGFRDLRGVPVVGAWTWLPEYEFGVVTKFDVAEAYAHKRYLGGALWGLFGLLVASSAAIFLFSVRVERLNRVARRAAVAAKQLGQYHLEDKLGEGGMGAVYRARHALLQRPTAVKLLQPDRTTDEAIRRFQQEVRITAGLRHPNTVAVFDFGRTDEGVFYYAMEYLDGLTLERLVERYGPQPPARVVHILRQACGSLREAHAAGLIHRDVKPANLMLNRLGGAPDFLKVLDFGLVRAIDPAQRAGVTAAGTLLGTPLYMPPEGIDSPDTLDARGDLYSLASVGYFLLTGKPVFEGRSIPELCRKQAEEPPQPPSARLGRPVPPDLEEAILACLAKRPADRPDSAAAFADRLAACRIETPWTEADAAEWWDRHELAGSGTDRYALGETIAHASRAG